MEHLNALDCPLRQDLEASLAGTKGPAKTIMDGDVPLGAFGIVVKGDVGFAWALFSPELRERPVTLHRTTVREFRGAIKGLKRVVGTVRKGWEIGRTWLSRLGFEYEGEIDLPHGKFEVWALNPQS